MSMNQAMFPKQRQAYIAERVKEKGSIRVDELSQLLDVSDITIRRDLADLEKKGVLERTHGGAVCTEQITVETAYSEKDRVNSEAKMAIGELAASLVNEGETVLINSGSTTLQVIKQLARRKGIKIITNNAAALGLSDAAATIIFTGGTLRSSSHTFVGPFSSRTLSEINATKAIIGVDGLSLRAGLTSPVMEEAEITKTMLERVYGTVILAADYSKIGKVSSFRIAPVQDAQILITDISFNEDYRTELEAAGLKIMKAGRSK